MNPLRKIIGLLIIIFLAMPSENQKMKIFGD